MLFLRKLFIFCEGFQLLFMVHFSLRPRQFNRSVFLLHFTVLYKGLEVLDITVNYIVVGDHTIVPTLVCAHTRLCPHSFVSTLDVSTLVCVHTRLCPHSFVPTLVCAHTRLCPHSFVPTLVCAHTRLCPHSFVSTLVCGLTCLCQDTIVPIHDCAHMILFTYCTIVLIHHFDQTRLCPTKIVLIRLCPSNIVVTYNWAETKMCPDTIVPISNCTRNFIPTIVAIRDCAHTIRVFIRKLDTQFSYYYTNFCMYLSLNLALEHKFVCSYKGKLLESCT